MSYGATMLDARRRDGRRARDDPRDPGRGDVPRRHEARHRPPADSMIPRRRCVTAADGEIELNAGRRTVIVSVANTGDRPIQVGSHYHFAETNAALQLRPRAGARLPAQHAGRHRRALRAGQSATVAAGRARRRARRLRLPRRVMGRSTEPTVTPAMAAASHESRARLYAAHVRPDHRRPRAAGRHRALVVEVEHDLTRLRRGGQVRRRQGHPRRHGASQRSARDCAGHRHHQRAGRRLLGHRQGRRRDQGRHGSRGIGKAGNPDIQPGVDIVDRRRAPRSSPARA